MAGFDCDPNQKGEGVGRKRGRRKVDEEDRGSDERGRREGTQVGGGAFCKIALCFVGSALKLQQNCD